jgi:hypothetical protein
VPSVVKPLFTVDVGNVIVGTADAIAVVAVVTAATFVDIASIIDLFTSGCNLFIYLLLLFLFALIFDCLS